MNFPKILALTFALAAVQSLQAADVSALPPDPFLGTPFYIHSIEAGDSAQYHATLVIYNPVEQAVDSTAATATDSVAVNKPDSVAEKSKPRAAALYIHGFNDYFFQRELAEHFDSAGYAFYAIDLHKYGRSYRERETMGELRDIAEYYAELDSSIAFIRRTEGDSTPIVLIGHSTGGLIACLYAADRDNGSAFAAIVLNSPFLEMNYVWPLRRIAVPALSALGRLFPNLGIPRSENLNYDKSLHKSEGGEWDYDHKYKLPGSLAIDLGWIRAIHNGHVRIQEGLRLTPSVLVMHSGCSYRDDDWSEEYTYCDGVLNVEHIREFGSHLGASVRLEEIEGGLHDLILSHKPARDNAYKEMFNFLDSRIAK